MLLKDRKRCVGKNILFHIMIHVYYWYFFLILVLTLPLDDYTRTFLSSGSTGDLFYFKILKTIYKGYSSAFVSWIQMIVETNLREDKNF